MCFWAAAWANHKIPQPSMRGLAVCKVLLSQVSRIASPLSSLFPFSCCLFFFFLSSFPLSLNSPSISFSLPLSLLVPPFPPSLLPPFLSCPFTCARHCEMRSCRLLSRLPSSQNILWLPLGSVSVVCISHVYPLASTWLAELQVDWIPSFSCPNWRLTLSPE